VCGQCAARRELTEQDLVEGAQIRGAAAFVEEVMAPGARSLVY
jgi:predicted peroxiredoxin